MNPLDELSIIRTVNAVGTTADGKDGRFENVLRLHKFSLTI